MPRQAAEARARGMVDRVFRLHAEGDHFAPERLRLLRLVSIAMGTQRHRAGQLLAEALEGDRGAEAQIHVLLTDLILQT